MRRRYGTVALAMLMLLPGSVALAQTTSTSGAQTTTTTQSTQSAFDKLSPGGQKIALALCGAQAGGCPTGQSTPPTTSTSTTTTSSSKTLTLDAIAQMKQHRGWGEIFKDMQKSGQIPADVKNLGQLVSGRYQAQSSTGGTTITTASGKTQVVGSSGSPGNSGNSSGRFGKGHGAADGGASAGGGSSASSHSVSGNHGGGHAK
jgi:hypothetical protein